MKDQRNPGGHDGRFEGEVTDAGKTGVLAIAREGGRVVVADIDGSAAIACTAQIAAERSHALTLAMDIADALAVAAQFETAERHFGGAGRPYAHAAPGDDGRTLSRAVGAC